MNLKGFFAMDDVVVFRPSALDLVRWICEASFSFAFQEKLLQDRQISCLPGLLAPEHGTYSCFVVSLNILETTLKNTDNGITTSVQKPARRSRS
jgi:hypothetical protein